MKIHYKRISLILSNIIAFSNQQTPLKKIEPEGLVFGFGDFNNDRLTDLIILDKETKKSLTIYKNNKEEFIRSEDITDSNNGQIENVVLLDFDNNGLLDVLVMYKKDKEEIKMQLFLQNESLKFDSKTITSGYKVQPFVIDYLNNGNYDLVGHKSIEDYENGIMSVWENKLNESSQTFEIKDYYRDLLKCKLRDPNYSAYIDIDGDCLADVVLSCEESYKVLFHNDQTVQSIDISSSAKMVNLFDFDNDGLLDIMFVDCIKEECSINILYNTGLQTQNAPKGNDESPVCAKSSIKFDMNDKDSLYTLSIKEALKGQPKYNGYTFIPDTAKDYPLNIRLSDLNLDGYMDVVLTVSDSKKSTRALVLYGSACKDCKTKNHIIFEFDEDNQVYQAPSEELKYTTVLPFDFKNTGSTDFLVQTQEAKLYSVSSSAAALTNQNEYFDLSYFIKIFAISKQASNYKNFKERPYSTPYFGCVVKASVLKFWGGSKTISSLAMSQTANLPLQHSYSIIGLGKSNNFIKEITIITPQNQLKSTDRVVSNSVLYAIAESLLPPANEDEGFKNIFYSSSWLIEQFAAPKRSFVLASIITFSIAFSLSLIVTATLKYLEKVQDNKEKQMEIHNINYDVL